MKAENNNPRKNDSGYTDNTAYEALSSVVKKEKSRDGQVNQAIALVKKLLKSFGLEIVGRIHIKDTRTGKKYY